MTSKTEINPAFEPEEVNFIKKLLDDIGIKNYDPIVINQLLYFKYNNAANIVADTIALSNQENKANENKDNVALALSIQQVKKLWPENQ